MTIYDKIDALKARIDIIRPFEGEMLAEIKKYYRVGLTWSSNALEGNSLTESETKVLLEDGLTTGGKPLRDTFEALGHARSYDFMFTLLDKNTVTEADVLTLHSMFYYAIDEKQAGIYRKKRVVITGSKHGVASAEDIPHKMKALFEWIERDRRRYHPVEFAALLHKKFVFIHPFIDGNGRLARLLMNAALLQDGYMLAIIPPVLRQEYIQTLEKAHTSDAAFVQFIAERVHESEKEIIRLLNIA